MTIFAKRHYEAIALVCQEYRRHSYILQTHKARVAYALEVETRLADMFKADNPAFDRDHFLFACLPGSNVKAKTLHQVAS